MDIEMSEQYIQGVLRLSVAQICQTIGYHAIQTTPMQLLQDTLYKFLNEISRDMKRHIDHYNRTEANLDDVHLCLKMLNINTLELFDYINNVQPLPLAVEGSSIPGHKYSNLNFLKPGSKEVLTRPMHIYEHLPPTQPSDDNTLPPIYIEDKLLLSKCFFKSSTLRSSSRENFSQSDIAITPNYPRSPSSGGAHSIEYDNTSPNTKNKFFQGNECAIQCEMASICLKASLNLSHKFDEEGRPTREICSAVMTSGGFISPAIEGKLPDSMTPGFFEKLFGLDAPPPPSPPPESIIEQHNSGSNYTSRGVDVNNTLNPFSSNAIKDFANNTKTTDNRLGCHLIATDKSLEKKAVELNIKKKPASNDIPLGQLCSSQDPIPFSKKVKRKQFSNSQLPLGKFNLNEMKVPEVGLPTSEKAHRRNKKFVQTILNTEANSPNMSPDFCNAVFQRLKMEKLLKKHLKYEKKLLQKQNYTIHFKKQNLSVNENMYHKQEVSKRDTKKNEKSDTAYAEDTLIPYLVKEPPPKSVSKAEEKLSLNASLTNVLSNNDVSPIPNTKSEAIVVNEQVSENFCTAQTIKEVHEEKLSAELDRNKLDIFKKISKQKLQKSSYSKNLPETFNENESQYFTLPSGTTITPAPTELSHLTYTVDKSCKTSEFQEKNFNMSCNMSTFSRQKNDNFSIANIPITSSINPSLRIDESNKLKKRGRKPGSRNLSIRRFELLNATSEVTELKKKKKGRSLKYTHPLPLFNLGNTSLPETELELPLIGSDCLPNSDFEQQMDSRPPTSMKDNRKEPRKIKINEQHIRNLDIEAKSKGEFQTINRMSGDKILPSVGIFKESILETGHGQVRPPLSPYQQQPLVSLMSCLPPNVLMSPSNLLKFCPFPSGPGLIPPTAQNLIYPRLPSTFHLPVPSIKHNTSENLVGSASADNGLTTSALLLQPKEERSFCTVPPLVPESMKLTPFKNSDDIPKLPNFDFNKSCKSVVTTSCSPMNSYEANKRNGTTCIQPTKTFEKNLVRAEPISSKEIMIKDGPIELSDDSADCASIAIDSNSARLSAESSLQFEGALTDFIDTKEMFESTLNNSEKYTSECGPTFHEKKNKKRSFRFVRGTKKVFQSHKADFSQRDFFSNESGGISKLAGGADLIPLLSTGSAYSSKTVPSNSLTASKISSFILPKKDYPVISTFKNSLLSANLVNSVTHGMDAEIPGNKKDHRKTKSLKAKKKKDRKWKSSENLHKAEKQNKIKLKNDLRCVAELKGNRDLLKKRKKDKKKKSKQLHMYAHHDEDKHSLVGTPDFRSAEKNTTLLTMDKSTSIHTSTKSFVPKLTLKLGSGQSSIHPDAFHKHCSTSSENELKGLGKSREPSPELARILPLVTRQPKRKFDIAVSSASDSINSFVETYVNAEITANSSCIQTVVPRSIPRSSGGTISASSVLLPQQLLQSLTTKKPPEPSAIADGSISINNVDNNINSLKSTDRQSPVSIISEASRPSSYIDAEGNRIWICPACGKVDDGSPMIGCDGCDAWYHWLCVGISIAPKDNEDWFCRVCITRKKGIHTSDKKRKRNKKK